MAGATNGTPAVIGITTGIEPAHWGDWVREAALLPVPYLRAVERAGAAPMLVPPTVRAAVPAYVERLDGLIMSGGADVDPGLYGEHPHHHTGPAQPHRDRFELALLRAVIEADLPFLAIGRGMQLLNVGQAGGLVQHLPDVVGGDAHAPAPGRLGRHVVRLRPGGRLNAVLGAEVEVASGHHQAVGRLGKGLVAVGWADDQVIEAIELQGHRFGLGVQWHPEEGDDPRLLDMLVRAAYARGALG